MFKRFALNVLMSIDQFANVLFLGDPDETISSRTSRALKSGKPKPFVKPLATAIDYVFALAGDKNHIGKSLEEDENPRYELWKWSDEP